LEIRSLPPSQYAIWQEALFNFNEARATSQTPS